MLDSSRSWKSKITGPAWLRLASCVGQPLCQRAGFLLCSHMREGTEGRHVLSWASKGTDFHSWALHSGSQLIWSISLGLNLRIAAHAGGGISTSWKVHKPKGIGIKGQDDIKLVGRHYGGGIQIHHVNIPATPSNNWQETGLIDIYWKKWMNNYLKSR